jgi:hypothetical protein
MASSAYNVPLSIFRNREWLQQFTIQNPDGSPVPLEGDALSLVVLRKGFIALGNITPAINTTTGAISFLFTDAETGMLVPSSTLDVTEGAYSWQFLRRAATNPNSDLMCTGPLTVNDSPPFPTTATPATATATATV